MILHSECWGASESASNSEKKKLVLLHGLGGNGRLWRPLAASLEDEYSILAPDQRGHGQSTNLVENDREASALAYGKDIMETMKHFNHYPSWVLGHSMGVRTALGLCQQVPEWIQGLVLIDIGLSGNLGSSIGARLRPILSSLPLEFESRALARQWLNENLPDPSIAQYLLAVMVPHPSVKGAMIFPFDRAFLLKTIDASVTHSYKNWMLDYAKTGKPAYLLRGDQSQVWSYESFLQDQDDFKAYSNIHFENWEETGHGLPFDKRKELVSKLKQWIA